MERRSFLISVAAHLLVLVVCVAFAAVVTDQPAASVPVEIAFHAPPEPEPQRIAKVEPPPPPPAAPTPVIAPPKPVVTPPKQIVKRTPPPVRREPAPKIARVVAPKPPPVKTAPPRKVETAGFAAVAPAPAPTYRPSVRQARSGSFSMPVTEGTDPKAPKRTVASTGGFAETKPTANTNRKATRTVASTGFQTTNAATTGSGGRKAGVQEGGFGSTAAEPVSAGSDGPARRVATIDTPVSIVKKPKPLYTDDARRLGIEGEVVLEVTFDASGDLAVLRVVDGLGYGLDEAAVMAAEKIEFEPAKRNGQSVNYTATLRVVFRLA